MAILLCSLIASLVAVTSAAIGLPTLPTVIPAAVKDVIPAGIQDVIPTGIPDVLPESVTKDFQNMPSIDDFHNVITLNGSIELHLVMYFPDDNGDPKPGKMFGNEIAGPVNETGVFFKLYTRNGPKDGELIVVRDTQSLKRSHFNASLPTYFVTHGFLQSSKSQCVQSIKNKYLSFHECNVIAIDWQAYSRNLLYFVVTPQVPAVAQVVADCAHFLVKEGGAHPARMHLIGFSLGAHIVGIAGKRFLSSVGKKVGRITGLDPAGPLFTVLDPSGRIDKDDADFVDVIHTCAWWLGMSDAIGHVDFYPNGGTLKQPGCPDNFVMAAICSHSKAWEFFAESIANPEFTAQPSSSYSQYKLRTFATESNVIMGHHAHPGTRGTYYLDTSDKPPFTMGLARPYNRDSP